MLGARSYRVERSSSARVCGAHSGGRAVMWVCARPRPRRAGTPPVSSWRMIAMPFTLASRARGADGLGPKTPLDAARPSEGYTVESE